ncbi:MAG TPA: signal recognition particle receptor subunit alpha, partial [Acidimicrobiia bacterium]|nr:signal recognition particle receptor subunit alpha [Acidimicrobiia bacterium]
MSGGTAALVLVGIFVLAVFLVVLGLGLSRRAQRRELGEDGPAAAGVAVPTTPAPAPARPHLRDRLAKTRAALATPLQALRGRGRVDAETWDDLEEALLLADVGVATT